MSYCYFQRHGAGNNNNSFSARQKHSPNAQQTNKSFYFTWHILLDLREICAMGTLLIYNPKIDKAPSSIFRLVIGGVRG